MKNTDDAKQELLNAVNANKPRQSVGGIAINLARRGGGSSGPTTFTKSVAYNGQKTILTIINVENGVEQQAYEVNIPHNAITLYPNIANPFTDYGGLSTHWMKCLISADLSTYTLFFTYSYEGRNFPIRVLTNWDLFNDNNINCVKITANADSTITRFNVGGNTPNLQYSTNGIIWLDYLGEIAIKKGSSILLRGNNPNGFNTDTNKYTWLELLGDVSLSGNVMGLLDNGTGSLIVIPNSYCFYDLFKNSTGITSVSDDFLPATVLKNNCYEGMFYQCTSLIKTPHLPATNLAQSCYRNMFNTCSNLKNAPNLPATSLAQECYRGMFYNNKLLRIAPTLPATTLADGCYRGMFKGCSSLFSVKIAYTGNFADTTDAFSGWLSGVPSYGIIYYNGSDTTTGANAIPTGWVKVTF